MLSHYCAVKSRRALKGLSLATVVVPTQRGNSCIPASRECRLGLGAGVEESLWYVHVLRMHSLRRQSSLARCEGQNRLADVTLTLQCQLTYDVFVLLLGTDRPHGGSICIDRQRSAQ